MATIEVIKTICILATPVLLAIVTFLFMHYTKPLLDVVKGMQGGATFLKDMIEAAQKLYSPASNADAVRRQVELKTAELAKSFEAANMAKEMESAGKTLELLESYRQAVLEAVDDANRKYWRSHIYFMILAAWLLPDDKISEIMGLVKTDPEKSARGFERLSVTIDVIRTYRKTGDDAMLERFMNMVDEESRMLKTQTKLG